MKITESEITVRDIEIYASHGVGEQERKVGNEFRVTVSLRFDAKGAMQYDDLELTINYAEVIEIVRQVMLTPSQLLEHVAWRLINALNQTFPTVKGGKIEITKVHPPVSTPLNGATFSANWEV